MCYWSKPMNKVCISFSIIPDYTDSPAGQCANRASPHHLHHPARGSTSCDLYSPSPLPPLLSPPPLSSLQLLCGMASIRSAWSHHQWLLRWHHHVLLPAWNKVVRTSHPTSKTLLRVCTHFPPPPHSYLTSRVHIGSKHWGVSQSLKCRWCEWYATAVRTPCAM